MGGPFLRVLIYGAGGHGRVSADCLRQIGGFEILGFIDDDDRKKGTRHEGVAVIGTRTSLSTIKKDAKAEGILIAMTNGDLHREMVEYSEGLGLRTIGFIHPTARISPLAKIDPTAMIFPNVVVHVNAHVSPHAILNTGCIIEHDVEVGRFSHVAPGAVLCGFAKVGELSMIGAGSVVIPSKCIGSNSTIGAGSIVVSDIPDKVTAFGNPCKPRSA